MLEKPLLHFITNICSIQSFPFFFQLNLNVNQGVFSVELVSVFYQLLYVMGKMIVEIAQMNLIVVSMIDIREKILDNWENIVHCSPVYVLKTFLYVICKWQFNLRENCACVEEILIRNIYRFWDVNSPTIYQHNILRIVSLRYDII